MVRSDAADLRFTLDANILVYSVDRAAGPRHLLAVEIVQRSAYADCQLTLQALSEFYVVSTRKGMTEVARAASLVTRWLVTFPCAAASGNAVGSAIATAMAGRASYWDALLVATAAEAGCALILTEDMADGSTLGAVEIHNPFTRTGRLTARTRRLLDL
jgi:predicted nucleic acid-binding protein